MRLLRLRLSAQKQDFPYPAAGSDQPKTYDNAHCDPQSSDCPERRSGLRLNSAFYRKIMRDLAHQRQNSEFPQGDRHGGDNSQRRVERKENTGNKNNGGTAGQSQINKNRVEKTGKKHEYAVIIQQSHDQGNG